MPDSLPALEQERSLILAQILELGDFRSGSITPISSRCGKPNCRCHQPGQPGHGPNYRLTRKINGKTVSETFSTATELDEAQREVEAFHRFRELSQRLLDVNEKICRARPVEDSQTPRKKKTAETIQREAAREIATLLDLISTGSRKSGALDLEAIETATWAATHQLGAKLLEQLLSTPTEF